MTTQAFTLMEVLVAVAMLTLMVVSTASVLTRLGQGLVQAQERQEARAALGRLVRRPGILAQARQEALADHPGWRVSVHTLARCGQRLPDPTRGEFPAPSHGYVRVAIVRPAGDELADLVVAVPDDGVRP